MWSPRVEHLHNIYLQCFNFSIQKLSSTFTLWLFNRRHILSRTTFFVVAVWFILAHELVRNITTENFLGLKENLNKVELTFSNLIPETENIRLRYF